MPTLKGKFAVASWNEDTYDDRAVVGEGAKLTRASVGQTYSGDIDGNGTAEWLMSYRADGTAHFVGLQTIGGTVGGRTGSFVLDSIGEFDGSTASGELSVVEGSGAGALAGVTGKGRFTAPMGGEPTWELTLDLP
jgi:hypothetical protein